MATFATPDDLADLLQQDVYTVSATLVLDLVEGEMAHVAQVPAASLPSWIRGLGLSVAARIYANPVGLTSDAIDDYRRSFGGTFFTTAETERLREVAGNSAAFSITAAGNPYVAQAGGWPIPGWDVPA